MRYAIIADIHSNLTALKAVLDDIEQRGGADELWCLGDIVGYGPEPCQCISLLREYNHVCVAGNHDWAAIEKIGIDNFNPAAATACQWTARQLRVDDREYLSNLPLVIEKDNFTLVHGSPREPIWEYLVSTSSARQNLPYLKTKYCLTGHSHQANVFLFDEMESCTIRIFSDDTILPLENNSVIINPGSVGQPRDHDPRASYAIYDSEKKQVSNHRVTYDIRVTQEKMMAHGLPVRLITRLRYGI